MKDLIEKLETASEGSRELDAAIFSAVFHPGCWGHVEELYTHDEPCEPLGAAPHYTTSLDDAIPLVPEGVFWSAGMMNVARHAPNKNRAGPAAFLWTEKKSVAIAYAATPALALCIASLLAREASE